MLFDIYLWVITTCLGLPPMKLYADDNPLNSELPTTTGFVRPDLARLSQSTVAPVQGEVTYNSVTIQPVTDITTKNSHPS